MMEYINNIYCASNVLSLRTDLTGKTKALTKKSNSQKPQRPLFEKVTICSLTIYYFRK